MSPGILGTYAAALAYAARTIRATRHRLVVATIHALCPCDGH